jgi:hypothetical protein
MSLAAGGAPVAVKHRSVNCSTKVRTSLYKQKHPFITHDIFCFLVTITVYSSKNFKDGIILKLRN